MDDGSTISNAKDDFEQECDMCGCALRVKVTGQKGVEEDKKYRCPDCGKTFTIRASSTPEVTRLKIRKGR